MEWYQAQCDGDWEHSNVIEINSLDNPGWSLKVDVGDTKHSSKTLDLKEFISDDNWFQINCDGTTFKAFGDSSKLILLCEQFRSFINQ
ncbi:MAG: Imm53 family immunity protein [Bacteroidota bacterium]